MIKSGLLVCCLICIYGSFAQDNTGAVRNAFEVFEKDVQLKYAVSSITIAEAESGKIVFSKNANYGLAPASTLKIITAATAFALLGPDYRFKTSFQLYSANAGATNILVSGNGDPTLGSSRFISTTKSVITDNIRKKLLQKNITSFKGLWYSLPTISANLIPREWIWEDIGNYYGASWSPLNWNENQYTIWLSPGKKMGDKVNILSLDPRLNFPVINELTTGSAQSGDNAYIFFNPSEYGIVIKGTVPCCRDKFPVYGAVPSPHKYALQQLSAVVGGTVASEDWELVNGTSEILYEHLSPQLDSIVYWFMQKSINLYGEALLQTMAKSNGQSQEEPVSVIKKFWQQKGVDINTLSIVDGSGLSPSNRVTTAAMSSVLVYSRKQKWFPAYYRAFSETNGMKVKSGTIGGVRAYAGYFNGKSGKQYCFSFIVNNYNGSVSTLSAKMFAVINALRK